MRRKADGQLDLLVLDPPQAAAPVVAKKKPVPVVPPSPIRQLFVCKQDGSIDVFDERRVSSAIANAFKAVRIIPADEALSNALQSTVDDIAGKTVGRIFNDLQAEVIGIDRIDDAIENQLMCDGYLAEARQYILFREDERRTGEPVAAELPTEAAAPADAIVLEPKPPQIEPVVPPLTVRYDSSFSRAIEDAVQGGLLSPELLKFDFGTLSNKLNFDRDRLLKPDVLQWLADTCFVHDGERHLETPQFFWMRIAMALAANEWTEKERRACEFYEALSTLRFLPSETILRNAGRKMAQPISVSGDINIAAHLQDGMVNEFLIDRTVTAAVRMLDNAIELNCGRKDFEKWSQDRPIAIGFVNLQETASVSVAYTIEATVYWATLESIVLAEERGPFVTYRESDWFLGILPIDNSQFSQAESGGLLEANWHLTKDWTSVRAALRQHGVRNGQLLALTPAHGSHKLLGTPIKKLVDELPTFLDEAEASKLLQSISS